jgi:GNAT superfamily N-acetyltransferase
MTEASVRAAVPADLDALVALLGELFALEADFRPDPDRQRRGLALLLEDRLRRAVFVAEVRGEVIGMVTGQLVVSTAEGAASVWVEDMVVAEGARRAGVGRRLLRAVEQWGAARGATRLQLLADRENLPALRFYEARGWSGTRLVCLRSGGA